MVFLHVLSPLLERRCMSQECSIHQQKWPLHPLSISVVVLTAKTTITLSPLSLFSSPLFTTGAGPWPRLSAFSLSILLSRWGGRQRIVAAMVVRSSCAMLSAVGYQGSCVYISTDQCPAVLCLVQHVFYPCCVPAWWWLVGGSLIIAAEYQCMCVDVPFLLGQVIILYPTACFCGYCRWSVGPFFLFS